VLALEGRNCPSLSLQFVWRELQRKVFAAGPKGAKHRTAIAQVISRKLEALGSRSAEPQTGLRNGNGGYIVIGVTVFECVCDDGLGPAEIGCKPLNEFAQLLKRFLVRAIKEDRFNAESKLPQCRAQLSLA